MIDIAKLPPEIVYQIAVALDIRPYEEIRSLSVYEALDGWLRYEGIIGMTGIILNMADRLRAAEVKPPAAIVQAAEEHHFDFDPDLLSGVKVRAHNGETWYGPIAAATDITTPHWVGAAIADQICEGITGTADAPGMVYDAGQRYIWWAADE